MAENRSITYFRDGAVVEVEARASRGIARIAVSADAMENTLRIKPLPGTGIRQVDILPGRTANKGAAELERLQERKGRLEDRLKALATREEIFTSAAKSQSGKAPRRTKTNPDPVQSIRQGTEFAIAQLEAVYTARRTAEQEIRHINERMAAVRSTPAGADRIARVAVTPHDGRIRVRYALAGPGWLPRYDFRLNGGASAHITLYGQLPAAMAGYRLLAAPGSIDDPDDAHAVPVAAGSLARLAEYTLPVGREEPGAGLRTSFSCLLTNPQASSLPAGEADLFRNGEYLGKVRFQGISSGGSRQVSLQ